MLIINRMLCLSVFLVACTVHVIGPLLSISGGPQVEILYPPPPQKLQAPCIHSHFWPRYDSKIFSEFLRTLFSPASSNPKRQVPSNLMGSTPWQHAYKRLANEGWSLWARFDQSVIGRSWLWEYMECSQPHPFIIGATEYRHQRRGAKELLWELTARLLCCKNRAELLDMIAVVVLASKTFAGYCVIKTKGVTLCWQRHAVLF